MTPSEQPPAAPVLLSIRIYLEDTDAGGIVYHTSYLRFMERARTELLRQVGLQQSDSFKTELSFVVHSMNLRFHATAVLDDEVTVSCELTQLSGASLTMRQAVRSSTGTLIASAEVVVACIHLQTKRPRRIPPELAQAFSQMAAALPTTLA